jgi:PAS domain S-box-containing protein
MKEKLTVLLVDDNPDDRLLVVRLLRAEFPDFRALEVRTQGEFDHALEEGAFDAVVTDYHVHWIDGLQVLAAVKQQYPDIPVIMLTGTGTEEVAVEGMKRGLSDYLLKRHMARLPTALRRALERADAQRRTLELEARLQTLLNQLDVGVFRLTREGELIEANQAALQLAGLSSFEEARQIDIRTLFVRPRDRVSLLRKIVRDKGLRNYPLQVRRIDGRAIWVSLTLTMIPRPDGSWMAEGIIEDITERVKAQAEIEAAHEYLRTLHESSPDAIIATDTAGRVTVFNPGAEEMLGYRAAEIVSQPVQELYPSLDQAKAVKRAMREAPGGRVQNMETTLRHKDGRLIPVLLSAAILRDSDGNEWGTAGYIKDITERKQIEERIRRREAILEAVAFAAEKFLKTTGWESDIEAVLQRLGEAAGVSRAYIFENHTAADGTLLTSIRYEWAAPGIRPQIDKPVLHDFPWRTGGFARWADTLATGSAVSGLVKDFPPEERYAFEAAGIQSIAIAPIFVEQEWWGVVGFDDCLTERHWSSAELDALKVAADTLGAAIQNARLLESERSRRREIEAVQKATLGLTASLDLSEVLASIARATMELTPAHNAHIYLYSRGKLEFGASLGADGREGVEVAKPRPSGLTYTVARSGELIVVPDMHTHPLFEDAPPHWQGAVVGLPLRMGTEVVGVMNVVYPEPHVPPESELRALRLLADQAAIAIQNARLMEAERASRARAEVLREATRVIASSLELREILSHILEQLKRVLTYDRASVLIFEGDVPELVAGTGFEVELLTSAKARDLLRKSPILRQMARDLQPIVADDVRTLEGWIWVPTATNVRSWMGIPLVVQNRMIGALMIDSTEVGFFGEEDVRVAQTLAQHVAQAVENARLHQEVRRRARQVIQILDTAPEGILLLDSSYRVELANPTAREQLAALTDRTQGDVLRELGGVPIEDLLEPRPGGLPHEIAVVGPSSRHFELIASPLEVGKGIGGWVVILRDVTEEWAVQEQLRQHERLAAVGQLAAGIAHDFNNLLQGIIGFAELLQRKPELDAGTRRGLEVIATQGQRAAQLIRQILDFSRHSVVDQQPLDLLPLARETVKLLQRTLPENIHISLEHEPGSYMVNADAGRLQQVITNLAVNSRDAMPDGGELRLRLSRLNLRADDRPPVAQMSPGPWICMRVADGGTGIARDVMPHIFEPFFTTKEVGKGTGLGLAQVFGIVKQHDGHISVESPAPEFGTGAAFTIYLPEWCDPEAARPSETVAEWAKGKGETILVVDDDDTVRQVCRAMLTSLGYRVLTARDGQQALETYRNRGDKIAVVLSDIVMPQMGGIDLARELGKLDPEAKVILITGYPLGNAASELMKYGIAGWLQKPLSLDHLAEVVREAIGGAGSQGERE